MNSDELVSLIEREESTSVGVTSGDLAEQRRKALQYYYGEKYGNEVEGRSSIVTTEVFDAIEGLLPPLLAIFTSSDDVVRFEPQSPQDEQAAQQATDYVNYIFSRLNNGFVVLYCLFKDALLQKNGFTKIYWEEYSESLKEEYEGLTDDEMAYLLQGEGLEVLEHSEESVQTPMGPIKTHDVKIQITKEKGRVCIEPVPPEELLVSSNTTNDLKNSRFVEHRTKKSISQLREMGYDVPEDIADDSAADFSPERTQRLSFDDPTPVPENREGPSKEVWVCEAYIRADYDDDGIAELRKVTKVGKTILKEYDGEEANEEVDTIPFVSATPIMMPHKLFGLSIADVVSDIQLTKSTVTRQLMDNAYNANNGRYAVLEGAVNIDDLLTSRPGGVVRMRVPGAVTRLDTPLLGAPTFQLLDYWDRVMDNRIGVSPAQLATDPNLLNAKAHTAEIMKDSSQQRVQLIARIFAETGVKDLFWKILELVCKHQNKPQVVRLRDQWVTIDPREWKNKFDMTVTVGLGTGSQSTTLNGAMGIMQIQQGMFQTGLAGRTVTEGNVFEAAREYAKAVFPKKAGMFFTDPRTLPPAEPKQDPKMALDAQKLQLSDQQKKAKMQIDLKKHQDNLAQERLLKGADIEQEMRAQNADVIHEHIQNSMAHGVAHAHQHMQVNSKTMRQEPVRQEPAGPDPGLEMVAEGLNQLAQAQMASAQAQATSAEQTDKMISVLANFITKEQPQISQMPSTITLDVSRNEKPSKKRRITVKRDSKGNMVGADVEEQGKKRRVTVQRDSKGDLVGADIEED